MLKSVVVAADAVVAWMPGRDSLTGVFSSPNSLAEVVAGSMVTGFVAKWDGLFSQTLGPFIGRIWLMFYVEHSGTFSRTDSS